MCGRAIKEVCRDTKPMERTATNMALQEIDDRLKNILKEIEDAETQKNAVLVVEKLIREQKKLIEDVIYQFHQS